MTMAQPALPHAAAARETQALSPAAGPSPLTPPRPLIVRLGKRLRPWINRVIAGASRVPNDPVLNQSLFPWMKALRAAHADIQAEAQRILAHSEAIPPLNEISPDHARIAADGKWRSFFLYGYGYRVEANCERAPRTAALLRNVPGLNSAFFSILAPGAHIPRHQGVTKGLLTGHLGLAIPRLSERCRMQVANVSVNWRLGEFLVFVDSQPHEVWNNTPDTRVVLLLHFARPTRLLGALVSRLFLAGVRRTAFIQEARKNMDAWEDDYRRVEAN